jgi:hypothetical protein
VAQPSLSGTDIGGAGSDGAGGNLAAIVEPAHRSTITLALRELDRCENVDDRRDDALVARCATAGIGDEVAEHALNRKLKPLCRSIQTRYSDGLRKREMVTEIHPAARLEPDGDVDAIQRSVGTAFD